METLEQWFSARVIAFLALTGMPPTTFGMKAVGDPSLMRQIKGGRSPTLRTADRVLAFMDEYGLDSGGARAPPRRCGRGRSAQRARTTRKSGAMTEQPKERKARAPVRFLRMSEIQARTGVSRTTIYNWVAEGRFPPPVRLGTRAIGWPEPEFEEWSRERIEKSRDVAEGGAHRTPRRRRTE